MMIQARPPPSVADLPPVPTPPTPTPFQRWGRRLVAFVRAYPVPSGTILLLAVSLGLWLARQPNAARWPLLLIVLVGTVRIGWELLQQVRRREFGVDFIAALAIIGSLILGQYLAGAIIVLMLSGGEALETFALQRARTSLAALAERAPRFAHVREGQQLRDISADAVAVGMHIVIKPGELIPVDGVVIAGSSDVSEADLTGEPVPVRKDVGMQTLSGSVNLDGVLDVLALHRAADSQYAKILELMQEAQENKAPINRLADTYSVGFTIFTLVLAGLAWLISRDSIYALAVLVVATPCPLILATPIAIMSGINRAAKQGVIVKSGGAMEQLGEADVAVFDKTGTLTMGIPQLKAITTLAGAALTEADLLPLIATIEQFSAHVLAKAVVEAAQTRSLSLGTASDVHEVFGKGVQGMVTFPGANTTRQVAVGNRTFMKHLGVALPPSLVTARERCVAQGEIGSFILVDGAVVGLLVLADLPRPDLARLSPELKAAGITETILLTGDGELVAQRIGTLAQMDRVVANCLPGDKVATIRALVAAKRHVLMVGDGVNDAPALASASVGIAVGTQGLTAASSAADAVLLSTDILRIASVIRLGRWVMHIARQGIWVGMGLSGIAMIFAALGFIEPAAGALLQEGIDVVVILNALRAGRPPQVAGRTT
ncbi:MAG: heavy metal translocating P-type ATPase [Ktedonobacterales bacterium]|nr:heavy metal translocating P-type ATPase [Ktedonobacterales bacterium]